MTLVGVGAAEAPEALAEPLAPAGLRSCWAFLSRLVLMPEEPSEGVGVDGESVEEASVSAERPATASARRRDHA